MKALHMVGLDNDTLKPKEQRRCVLLPSGRLFAVREWVILLFTLFNVVFIPINAFFSQDLGGLPIIIAINAIIDVAFIIDFVLNFFTGYLDEWGELTTDKKLIWTRYMRTSLLIDLLACIPFDSFALLAGYTSSDFLVAMLRISKVLRFNKILHSPRLETSSLTLRLVRLIGYLILTCHWVACIFFGIAKLEDHFYPQSESWISVDWSHGLSVVDQDLVGQYSTCLYWSVVTMLTVGYGDIIPKTSLERMYTAVVILLGSIYWAVMYGNISLIISSTQQFNTEHKLRIDSLHEFIRHYKLPTEMAKQVLFSERQHFKLTKGLDLNSIVDSIKQPIKSEVMSYVNTNLVRNSPYFASLPSVVVDALVSRLERKVYLEGQLIAVQGEPATSMYFLSRGKVQLFTTATNSGKETVFDTFLQGTVFGEQCMMSEHRQDVSVRAVHGSVEVCSLSKSSYEHVRSMFPEVFEKMEGGSKTPRAEKRVPATPDSSIAPTLMINDEADEGKLVDSAGGVGDAYKSDVAALNAKMDQILLLLSGRSNGGFDSVSPTSLLDQPGTLKKPVEQALYANSLNTKQKETKMRFSNQEQPTAHAKSQVGSGSQSNKLLEMLQVAETARKAAAKG